jgi:hypothetical protein
MAHAEPGGDDGHQGIGPGMAGVIVLLVLLYCPLTASVLLTEMD